MFCKKKAKSSQSIIKTWDSILKGLQAPCLAKPTICLLWAIANEGDALGAL